ncbi:MAG: hypothetical protein SFV51_04995 [Bryobacteraceae bacterium]|nr:hypothetical protein [Bryobacteraceae bacterium]
METLPNPHFELSQWIDYVRELADVSLASAMRDHLARSCPECARTYQQFSAAYFSARALAAVDVPSQTVARAKAVFPPRPPRGLFDMPSLLAKLVFQSVPDLAPAGLRAASCSQPGSHRAYEAGEYRLNVREEPAPGDLRVLIGQVQPGEGSQQKVSGLPVFLIGGKQLLGRAMTNEFGEFQLEFHRRGKLRLLIAASDVYTNLEFEL